MRSSFAIAILILANSAAAQNANLSENNASKDCMRVEIRTKVEGHRIYSQAGEKKQQPVKLEAGHRCVEKIISANDSNGMPNKVARNYEAARSTLTLGSERPGVQTLRVDRSFIMAQRNDDALTVYSPKGPLFRDELELVGEHFDTMALAGLLPGKEVGTGATWQLANPAVLGLCQFEGLVEHSLTGKLDAVAGNEAKIIISGAAKGIDGGAQVVLSVSATATFDIAKRKVTSLEWKQEDQRDQGPLSPGFNATVTVLVTRVAADEPAELSDAVLASLPRGLEAPAAMTAIAYRDPTDKFEMTHPRDWRLIAASGPQTIMRLVERGDLIAQATITTIDRVVPGQHMDVEKFKEQMMASPGWEAGQVIEAAEVKTTKPGRYIYRVIANGTLGDKQIVQAFYLIADGNGNQVVVAFQTEQQKATKLGSRDVMLIDGLELAPKR